VQAASRTARQEIQARAASRDSAVAVQRHSPPTVLPRAYRPEAAPGDSVASQRRTGRRVEVFPKTLGLTVRPKWLLPGRKGFLKPSFRSRAH
jgi:hypothetical protein